jgi:hypothetical protein
MDRNEKAVEKLSRKLSEREDKKTKDFLEKVNTYTLQPGKDDIMVVIMATQVNFPVFVNQNKTINQMLNDSQFKTVVKNNLNQENIFGYKDLSVDPAARGNDKVIDWYNKCANLKILPKVIVSLNTTNTDLRAIQTDSPLESSIQDLQKQFSEFSVTMKSQIKDLNERDKRKDNEINDLKGQIIDLNERDKRKDNEINDLKGQIIDLKGQIIDLNEKDKKKDDKLSILNQMNRPAVASHLRNLLHNYRESLKTKFVTDWFQAIAHEKNDTPWTHFLTEIKSKVAKNEIIDFIIREYDDLSAVVHNSDQSNISNAIYCLQDSKKKELYGYAFEELYQTPPSFK